ncbi:hypothetical protein HPB47_026193 [Ixodes persulcatus]|uniref:Uncharacterized protein n=1 Tax=Ixodes persulcatus TaxID=34615 RepID=A0AC60PZW3_IXOPE|nr:hypothetical protein HPB47_026193 [Ixodes persulcatus]
MGNLKYYPENCAKVSGLEEHYDYVKAIQLARKERRRRIRSRLATAGGELSFLVPVNLSFFQRKLLDRSKELGLIPYDTPDHQADLHEDVAEPSPLLMAEDIARANVKHENIVQEGAEDDFLTWRKFAKKAPGFSVVASVPR